MAELKLNDGTILEVEDSSTFDTINVRGDLATVTNAMNLITTDNLKNAEMYDAVMVNKIYTGLSGSRDGDIFFISFSLRDKTENEIIQERLDEQDAALMELAEMIVG